MPPPKRGYAPVIVAKCYEATKRNSTSSEAVMDDLIILTLQALLIRCNGPITSAESNIHVDEYQDTNHARSTNWSNCWLLALKKYLASVGDATSSYGISGSGYAEYLGFWRS